MVFIGMAAWKRINVYDAFIEGAKDGFATAVKIIPYLIAILVAIGVFRASGAMEVVMSAITRGMEGLGFNADWVDALPTALMKPLSGSGARGMMIDTMKTFGADLPDVWLVLSRGRRIRLFISLLFISGQWGSGIPVTLFRVD